MTEITAIPFDQPKIDWNEEKLKQDINKIAFDIKSEEQKLLISKLEVLRWMLGTEIPDPSKNFTSETTYMSAFTDGEIEDIKEKIMELVNKL